jgi:hypothetical protein
MIRRTRIPTTIPATFKSFFMIYPSLAADSSLSSFNADGVNAYLKNFIKSLNHLQAIPNSRYHFPKVLS